MSAKKRKPVKAISAAEQARRAQHEERMLRYQLTAGYVVVGVTVLAGFAMSFWPRLFGLQQCSPAVGIGLAILAVLRLAALRKEVKKQALEASAS